VNHKRHHLEALLLRLSETREELVRADAKASALLSAEGVIAGVLLAAIIVGDWTPASLPVCLSICWWVAASAGLGSLVSLGIGVYPRTRAVRPAKLGGPAYYGDDIRSTGTKHLPEVQRVEDQLSQLTRIVRIKYRTVKTALWLFGGSVAALFVIAIIDLLV
jgi:hypothetical protein